MGLLVCAMDVATANNTVAIVMANPIAKEMAQEYGVSPRKTASLLDTFSCISQGAIPYGAQMLVAISAASELGFEVTAFFSIRDFYCLVHWCLSFCFRKKIHERLLSCEYKRNTTFNLVDEAAVKC